MIDKSSGNLENIFRKAYNSYSASPSSGVLRKIRFQLWVSDFFSLKPRKFNIVYAALILGGVASAILLLPNRNEYIVTAEELAKTELQNDDEEGTLIIEKEEIEPSSFEIDEKFESEMGALPVALYESDFVEGCAPLKIHFFNKSTSTKKVKWDFGNGDESDLLNPVYIFSEPGLYNVSLTASNERGKTDTHTQTIQVLASPKAEFSIDIGESVIKERKVVFDNLSEDGKKYIWDFGDATKDSGFEISHEYKNFGSYNVSLVAIADNGCMDTITHVNKFIKENYELYFPVSFRPSPNNKASDGFYEKAGQEVSVFYPRNFGAKEYELHIYTPNGIEVFSTTNIKQGWNGYVRGRLVPGGIYSYRASGIYPNGKPFLFNGKMKVIVEEYYQN
jgi:PKD repeat protein